MSKPMRLAIITHNVKKGDGQGRVNYEIVRHASQNGVQVTLLSDVVAPEVLTWPGVTHLPVSPPRMGNWLVYGYLFAKRANRVIEKRRGDWDVINACGYTVERPHHVNASHFVHSAWLRSPVHVSRTERGARAAYQWLYSAANARFEKIAYRQAQQIVAVSGKVKEELVALGLPGARIEVILNGADPDEFFPAPIGSKPDRAALGLPPNVPLALFVGDIRTTRKNLDTVLKAVALSPGVHLAVGGRVEGSPFPALAQKLGIADRVHFLDFRRDVADIMRASDVFVFPSRYEACTLVLMEAMASGLPIVTADSTGGAEVVTPDAGFRLPDENDANAVAQAMQTVLGDAVRRETMALAAKQIADQHTWTRVAEAYLTRYRQFAP